ncbi:MAG: GntR family transcriptional regulator [Pseudomonadota bacterium]
MTGSLPRYRLLAQTLRQEIEHRALVAGDPIPTEMEICSVHNVSRHTAREALRILTEDGLIERRRGAGTVVADRRVPAFAQAIDNFESILQYARDAHLAIFRDEPCTDDMLDRFGLTGQYHAYIGLRRVADEPAQAFTIVAIPAEVAPSADVITALTGPISDWLEEHTNTAIAKVTQRMEACAITGEIADLLGVSAGSPGLRTTRRYRDASGAIVLLSESTHPAGRFAYEIRLDRTRA